MSPWCKEYMERGDILSGCPQKGTLYFIEKWHRVELMTVPQSPLERRSQSWEVSLLREESRLVGSVVPLSTAGRAEL